MTERDSLVARLEPCPFCGCTDVSNNDNGHEEWFECDWCHATSGYDPEFESEPTSFHWNRRAALSRPEQVVALAVSDAMVKRAAAVLLGRVNAPEQEIYSAARAALEAALPGEPSQPVADADVAGELADIEASLDDAIRYLVDCAGSLPSPMSPQNARIHIDHARMSARRLADLVEAAAALSRPEHVVANSAPEVTP